MADNSIIILFIKNTIRSNAFLNYLFDSEEKLDAIVKVMKLRNYRENEYIVHEGDEINHCLYVTTDGLFELTNRKCERGVQFGKGVIFGEICLLYNYKQQVTIRSLTDNGKVWTLWRSSFHTICRLMESKESKQKFNLLKRIPSLHGLHDRPDLLIQISYLLKTEFYETGTSIVTPNSPGDKLFIIIKGTVIVKEDISSSVRQHTNRILKEGDYFGHEGLISSKRSGVTMIANFPGTKCLTLDRNTLFLQLGSINYLMVQPIKKPIKLSPIVSNICDIPLDDLQKQSTLGVGSFGRVDLVRYKDNQFYALKRVKRTKLHNQDTTKLVEKSILEACDSPFIVRHYKTYVTESDIYFLMEPCLNGNIGKMIRRNGCLTENKTKSIIACVVQALDYLHERNIIYRDLKPDNLVMDSYGTVKLIDFGVSTVLRINCRVRSFAGTIEFMAPEIILNKSYDRAVDFWSLGTLIYVLLIGKTPFYGTTVLDTFMNILRGFDHVRLPATLHNHVQHLIILLCNRSPIDRLGYRNGGMQSMKRHPWFHKFNWNLSKYQSMKWEHSDDFQSVSWKLNDSEFETKL